MDYGAVATLPKPFDKADLLKVPDAARGEGGPRGSDPTRTGTPRLFFYKRITHGTGEEISPSPMRGVF